MASRTPLVVQNENVRNYRGKGVDGVKADLSKPAKTGRQVRKALTDLSNTGTPLVAGVSKTSALKEKSGIRGRQTTLNAPKSTIFTDEEIKICNEWAREGIEHAHFTGNDLQKLQSDMEEERIKKKVEKVLSGLHEWSNVAYDFGLPVKEVKDTEYIAKIQLEPELPPLIKKSSSVKKDIVDLPFDLELDHLPIVDHEIEFKLKDEPSPQKHLSSMSLAL
ncbi:uncharacterized protein LOC103708566 [Phoenix dactylifera]|uniref:Uncharacterized protein LOC103708566 n=1 Tax=Phoenix dactylifera TaxID=42345 RepID=A0A8B7C4R3_PHODC|nr:uncharacterized protein LOC103708566 [Phoenix dactylifera]XP_008791774.1 uncharacterized protein LOC103708566 [Phoenix dactylifera]